MNWAQFKDPVSDRCLAGTVVAFWSLTQEVAEWQVRVLLLQWQFFSSLNSLNLVKTFRKNSIDLLAKIFLKMAQRCTSPL